MPVKTNKCTLGQEGMNLKISLLERQKLHCINTDCAIKGALRVETETLDMSRILRYLTSAKGYSGSSSNWTSNSSSLIGRHPHMSEEFNLRSCNWASSTAYKVSLINWLCVPEVHVLNANIQHEDRWRWEPSGVVFMPYKKKAPECSLTPPSKWGHCREAAVCELDRWLLSDAESASGFSFDFTASRTVRNGFLLFISQQEPK